MQQIVRIDRESAEPVSAIIENQLIEKIQALAPEHDAIIISDYALGVVTPKVIAVCQEMVRKHNLVWSVDSHQDLGLFQGATIATPNQPEAEENLGYGLTSMENLMKGGWELKHRAGMDNMLITRGSEGMSLFENDGSVYHIPVFNRSEVFDVTGAGDTVISTLTLALATGATPLEAATLGNLAASIVVKKYATATTSPAEMLETLEELDENLLAIDANNAAV
jgi:rfaE bifunctional protein kinase chain/domain